MTDTQITQDDVAATRLRQDMVDELRARGWIRSDRVAAAFLAVPRHEFAIGVPLEVGCGVETAVPVKHDANGRCISSISAPRAQAEMLEMSGVRDGDAVLEIGSGGVNAAMLAELVGPGGRVVTVDIDEEVTDRASRCLERTGYSRVTVALADAEQGAADYAPYDRILVTVGAWDIPPAWREQLAQGGTLTVPLRMRGLTRVVTFVREGERLASTAHEMFGFVPMQGAGGHDPHEVRLGDKMRLVFDDGEPEDPDALADAMSAERADVWTGVEVAEMTPFDLLHVWMATVLPGVCKLVVDKDAAQGARPAWPVMGPVTAQGASFAYPTCRKTERRDERGKELWEFGAIGHGPDGRRVAQLLAEQVRVWDRLHRCGPGPRILVYPADTPDEQIIGDAVIEKRHSRVAVQWQDPTTQRT